MPEASARPISEARKPAPGRRASGWLLAGPAVAAAAALALWLSNPTRGALAHYEIEVAGVSPQRAPSAVTIVLRPDGTRTEPVEAGVFAASAGTPSEARPVPFVSEAIGPGALRLKIASGALPEHGRLVVIVGRAGAMPRGPDTGSAEYGRGWQRFDVPFTLVAKAASQPE